MSGIRTLRRLTGRDFKRHKELIVEFSEGLTTIRGPNYSGKSSLLEMLLFAAGGSSFVPGGRAVIVRHGAKDCNVELEFDTANGVYKLIRSLKDAKLALQAEGDVYRLVATGHTAVNVAFEQLIGMPLKDWLTLSYSMQGEAAALMTLGASKLNAMIEQLSRVDFITKVSERAKIVEDKAAAAVKPLPEYLKDFNLDEALIESAALSVKLEELTAIRTAKEGMLKEAQALQEAFTKEIGAAREALKRHQELTQQSAAIEARLTQTTQAREKELAALEVHDSTMAEIDKLADIKAESAALKSRASEATIAARQAEALKETIKSKEEFLSGVGLTMLNDYRSAAGEIASLQAKVNELHTEYVGDQATLTAMKQDAERAEEAVKAGVCRTCKRPMEGVDHTHIQSEAATLKKEYDDAVVTVNELKGRLTKAKADLQELLKRTPSADIVTVYPQREKEVVEAKETLELINSKTVDPAQIKAWEDQSAAMALRVSELNKIKWEIEHRRLQIEKHDEALVSDRKLWVSVQDRLSEIKIADTSELEDKRAKLGLEVNTITTDVYTVRHEITDIEHKTNVLLARSREYREIVEANKANESRVASFGGLRKYLRDNKSVFMTELWDQLMALTSEFVSQVMEGDVTAVGRTEDGEFWMEEFGVRKPMIAASGGQKSICGVGLRLALPSLIPGGSRLILLDEPSADLNEQMSASLAGALKAQNRQIILVTHREGEEYVSDVVINLER